MIDEPTFFVFQWSICFFPSSSNLDDVPFPPPVVNFQILPQQQSSWIRLLMRQNTKAGGPYAFLKR